MDCPGRPVVKAPCFQCRGHRFNPCLGNWDLTCCTAWPKNFFKRWKFFKKVGLVLGWDIWIVMPLECDWISTTLSCFLFLPTISSLMPGTHWALKYYVLKNEWIRWIWVQHLLEEVKKSQHTSHERMWRIWNLDFGFYKWTVWNKSPYFSVVST